MGQIVFWGYQHGLGVTSNTAAIAALVGMEYQIRTLCSQPQWSDVTLEQAFRKALQQSNPEFFDFTGIGIDALERAVRSGKLQNNSIRNNSLFIERDRLDFLKNSGKPNQTQFEESTDVLKIIYEKASTYYDAMLLDLHSGTNSEVGKAMLQSSDLIVVCVNQNINVLEKYFESKTYWPEELHNKPHVLMVGQYDVESKYKIKNIANKYRYKGPILSIPYNTNFRDHYNDGDIKGFFMKNRYITRNHDNYYFMQEVRRAAEFILTEVGVNTKIKSIEKGVS
ncbi:hypothetical protein [Paenibacillus sp. PDC88]|uniref:N-formylglutamate amidohydrolase n=1 Tax=Paenibacillus provencensis TaxID=441151 RepID=A0ABW3Q1Z3_9BACL|nr:hypothetical protein [Paenibacillus sp. PDC88]SDX62386.1 hypothetical protein SAMN05518848_11056 [Paenibacillus sp. PDC88]